MSFFLMLLPFFWPEVFFFFFCNSPLSSSFLGYVKQIIIVNQNLHLANQTVTMKKFDIVPVHALLFSLYVLVMYLMTCIVLPGYYF